LLSTTPVCGGNMSEDEVKYLIFLAIKAERERIAEAIDKIYVSYSCDYDTGEISANLDKLVSDIAEAIAGSK